MHKPSKLIHQSLTDKQKHLIAWRETGYRLLIYSTILFSFFAVIGLSYWIFRSLIWLAHHGFAVNIILALLAINAILALILFKRQVYAELFSIPSTSWTHNTGKQPSSERVNIQRQDGHIEWNTRTKDLDWSLISHNPIITYHPKTTLFVNADRKT